jgi:UDP-N-acetylglucosamine 2-epimerase (non-hydrolysing)
MGTRPEAIKMAPVIAAARRTAGVDVQVVSTGQHREMLRQVIDLFQLKVDHELDVMQPNQTLASVTARLMDAIDRVLCEIKPDFVLGQGDTTTAFVTALASFYRRIPFGHVEAGLRTGDVFNPFPEEANRRLITPLAALHFAPTETSRRNLLSERVDPATVATTGNTVIDALDMEVARQQRPSVFDEISRELSSAIAPDWAKRPYVLITGHRRENFGGGFDQICEAVATLADWFPEYRFVYPVHLNPEVQRPVRAQLAGRPNVHLIAPQGYSQFIALLSRCKLVLTDSGGIQEEAPSLGKPVVVMRETTERPEGVEAGTVRLVGANAAKIVHHVTELLHNPAAYARMAEAVNPYGDGHASTRIIERVMRFLDTRRPAAIAPATSPSRVTSPPTLSASSLPLSA